MELEPSRFFDSRYAQLGGSERALQLADVSERFFSQQRDPEALARLFSAFRVGEHHAVVTIGAWLRDTPELDVKYGYARLIWDEARHTKIWTDRMRELVGEGSVARHFADPAKAPVFTEYYRLWDAYAVADSLPKRLAYIYLVDAWAGFAYTSYLPHIDSVTGWHLQTILADEAHHVSFGQHMADRFVTTERDREELAAEEERIMALLVEVTDGFLSSDI